MKNLTVLLLGLLVSLCAYTQADDNLNFKKYWKFRNNFRRDFIKIGPERGEGIAAVRRRPLDCRNNVFGEIGDRGTMSWGDGMIMHGHYIGMLALEYRMLRDRKEDYEGVLNELYYAINAINRVDLRAEAIMSYPRIALQLCGYS